MSQRLRIDVVTPPFGGHLHPQLDLATRLHDAARAEIRILSTPSARQAVELCLFPIVALLANREDTILGIANAVQRVGSNPFRLVGQLKDNLSVMDQLIAELTESWKANRPDLVIADFAVPVAGLLAQRMQIPWWTAIRAPTVIDTPDGIPPYMGGLKPKSGLAGSIRDRCGRTLIRTFKQSVHLLFRHRMKRFGIPSIYRNDGFEQIYSPEQIIVQGVRELEFPCTWPPSADFVGTLTASPCFEHTPPRYRSGKPHVLVSLGTHVRWAQRSAAELIEQVACRMPDFEFHFTQGRSDLPSSAASSSNFQILSYLPYDRYISTHA